MSGQIIYDDGIFRVTHAVVATPRRFYPIANTTARIRRDPLWAALGVAGFAGTAIAVYGDLLHPAELTVLAAAAGLALAAGLHIGCLTLDAPGHQPALIVATMKKIRALFAAIRDARSEDFRGLSPVEPVEMDSLQD